MIRLKYNTTTFNIIQTAEARGARPTRREPRSRPRAWGRRRHSEVHCSPRPQRGASVGGPPGATRYIIHTVHVYTSHCRRRCNGNDHQVLMH